MLDTVQTHTKTVPALRSLQSETRDRQTQQTNKQTGEHKVTMRQNMSVYEKQWSQRTNCITIDTPEQYGNPLFYPVIVFLH